MTDLIRRQDAIDAMEHAKEQYFDRKVIIGKMQDVVRSLPSAQPEITRCKDCIHLQKWRSEESAKKFGQIYECVRNVIDHPKLEDFCSHAERKSEDKK